MPERNDSRGAEDFHGNTIQSNREIVSVRVFDAPRDLVYRMFTEAGHVDRWWGPRGFRNTTHSMDVRVGGIWNYTMHGPDGVDYANEVRYLELVRPERIVYDHGVPGEEPMFRTTITLEEAGHRTRLTMRMLFPTAEERDAVVKKHGAEEGLHQTLDCLDAHLLMQDAPDAFVISREFAAARDMVWTVWTEKDHLGRWFGPKGFAIRARDFDFRPGGRYLYSLHGDDGSEMWAKFEYQIIEAPERIVFVNSFSNPEGDTVCHPGHENWPLRTLTNILFTENENRTIVTVRWIPLDATPEELRTFQAGHESMTGGWTGTLDQLRDHLTTL